jgi:dipeptidyl aminopeptidase/acylaminoacyl peptidase
MRVRGLAVAAALILAACDATPSPTPSPAPSPPTAGTPTLSPAPSSPSPTASPQPFAAGAVVQVLVDGLNIRTSASRDASAVGVVQAGQRVTIVSGPQSADGFSWYEVSRDRYAAGGWLAAGAAEEPWLAPVSSGRLAVRYQEGERVGIGLMDVSGGNPVVLEGNPTRISWSPDGTRIAFAQPGLAEGSSEIFVMRADGSDRQPIADGSQFAWSPDGTRLAVPEGSRITLRSADDGRDVGRLPLGALTAVADLAWSPDSRLIALTAAGSADGDRDVYVMRSDTGAVSRLTDGGAHDTPVWSPSANRLVFNSADGIVISDPAGEDERPLSDGRVAPGAWSPEGLFLLITRFGGLDSLDLRLQGSGTLVSDEAATTVRAGSWAPDGLRILYERVAEQGGAVQSWIANPDGSGATQLPNAAGFASWQSVLGDAGG